jgi:hypothetical protein
MEPILLVEEILVDLVVVVQQMVVEMKAHHQLLLEPEINHQQIRELQT